MLAVRSTEAHVRRALHTPLSSAVTRSALAAVLAAPLLGQPGEAHAQDPSDGGGGSAAEYNILYSITDENGDVSRIMTEQDMKFMVNAARCECGQDIVARITLSGTPSAQVQTEAYVGQKCDTGQGGVSAQFRPCAQLVAGFPQTFATGPSFRFNPVFLGWGVAPGSSQPIGEAAPVGGCSDRNGSGGIWMCEGAQSCQAGQFFISGNTSINTENQTSLAYDFVPPLVTPTDFEISPGDGAVEIRWKVDATGDIAGYRILCADEDGNPLPGRGTSGVSATSIPNGTIYFTPQNLCPDGPFTTLPDFPAGDGDGDGDGDTGTDGGTDGGDMPAPITSNISSLDWDYVCTGHLGFNTTRARVDGLENGRTYQFLVVAYDLAGNPKASQEIILATPVETNDLWEQCDVQSGTCGEGGFCSVQRDTPPVLLVVAGLFVIGFTLRRRSRQA